MDLSLFQRETFFVAVDGLMRSSAFTALTRGRRSIKDSNYREWAVGQPSYHRYVEDDEVTMGYFL